MNFYMKKPFFKIPAKKLNCFVMLVILLLLLLTMAE